jgi:peptidoglycan/xylan/chitin deacetylase (PgdA/CDA1 family)
MARRVVRAALAALVVLLAGAGAAHADVIVSLTFDDGVDDQAAAAPILAAHGMHATFFVNSGRVGHTHYLTLAQLRGLAAGGNEIGGHTAQHAHLTEVTPLERQRQICGDRAALLRDGFAVRSFAYPFGGQDTATQQVVASCGYDSGRLSSGIIGPTGCNGCPVVNPIPPENALAIRSVDSVESTTALEDVEQQVRAAAARGGWLPIVFHHVCDGCNPYGVAPAWYSAFLDFLATEPGVTVQTVGDVVAGPVTPAVAGDPLTPTGPRQLLQNGSLGLTDSGGVAACFQRGGTGTTRGGWRHVGSTEQVRLWKVADHSDRKLVTRQDAGLCAPAATPGARYAVRARYKTRGDARLVVYVRDADGRWTFLAQGPPLKPTGTWREARWRTARMPAGTTAISVGVSLRTRGTLSVDELALAAAG